MRNWSTIQSLALKLASPCVLCEHRCAARRDLDERGKCGLGQESYIYRHGPHLGEERALIPSYTIDFSACNMRCSFCSEKEHFRGYGRGEKVEDLSEFVGQMQKRVSGMKMRSIQFIGGEPSIHLPTIVRLCAQIDDSWPDHPPLYLNTNGYFSHDVLALMTRFIDGFVFDLKALVPCAAALGMPERCEQIVKARIREAGDAGSDIFVRHLMIPGHIDCCTLPIIRWVAQNVPNVSFNLMGTFVDFWGKFPKLKKEDVLKARQTLANSNLPHALYNGSEI